MSNSLVTVIVPVYNGEKSIIKCLDSILKQSYKKLEIIVIDDGSKDRSQAVVEEYLEKRKADEIDIKFFKQENQGVACTRNRGICLASGKYIAFIDQDDYIDQKYIEVLVQNIQSGNFNIVVSGYCRVNSNEKLLKRVALRNTEWAKFLNLAPWGKLYRLSYLKDNNLHFLNVKKGEDVYFNILSYAGTENISILPYVGYYWVDQEQSVTNRLHTKISHETDIRISFEHILKDVQKNSYISKDLFEYYFIKASIYDILFSAGQGGAEAALLLTKNLFEWLEMHFPQWCQNPNISFFKPSGERMFTKIVVKIFCFLYKAGLQDIFLRIFCKRHGW